MRVASLLVVVVVLGSAMTAQGVATASGPGESGKLIKYTALGDSVTWQQPGYVGGYAGYLAADLHATVSATNLGTPFWNSGALLDALQRDPSFQASVTSANVITIFIGLNDYQFMHAQYLDPDSPYCPPPKDTCMQSMVDSFQANWDAIIAQIKALNTGPHVVMRALTIYNPYVAQDTAQGNFSFFKSYLDAMNARTVSASAANEIRVADMNKAFNGPDGDQDATANGFFTAPDALHPNDYGRAIIAQSLRALGYVELDSDNDGFTDVAEGLLGTDPHLACGTNNWPPDYSSDGKVEFGDLQIALRNWNKAVSSEPSLVRYDLDLSGRIDYREFLVIVSLWNKRCTA